MAKNNFKEPYYSIYAGIYCSGRIYVNDVLVESWHGKDTKGEGGYSSDVPINQVLLQSGKYNVVAKMFPRYGQKELTENDLIKMDFYCKNVPEPKVSKYAFHPKLETPENVLKDGQVVNPAFQGLPYFEIKTEIEVELPFVLDGWQNSVDLFKLDQDNLRKQVLLYYRQLHGIISEHNAARFLEISKEKETLQAKAFYFNDQRRDEVGKSVSGLFGEKLEVLPFNESELKMNLMGYGKLVNLTRLDGSSALQFKPKDPEEQGMVELDVKLHLRNQSGQLSII